MWKKTITYESFDGKTYTEDFYFHLSRAELTEMELCVTGGMTAYIKRIVAAEDSKEIVGTFKELILKSYGVKSADGKRFIKNKELCDDFVQCEAYSILFMELATNADAASEFVNAVIPKPA